MTALRRQAEYVLSYLRQNVSSLRSEIEQQIVGFNDTVQGNLDTHIADIVDASSAGHLSAAQFFALKHIIDGGHPLNSYPSSAHADDAEFNSSVQSDNNTIGSIAGGDFWEWSSGDPSAGSGAYDINSTRKSHLYVSVHRLDADAVLRGDISSIPTSTYVNITLCLRFILPKASTTDEYCAVRVSDSTTGNYYEAAFRNDGTGKMRVEGNYLDGGAHTTYESLAFADAPGPEIIWLRWQQQDNNRYRVRFSLDGYGFYNVVSAAYAFTNTYSPNRLEIIFGKPDSASSNTTNYFVDSVRRS